MGKKADRKEEAKHCIDTSQTGQDVSRLGLPISNRIENFNVGAPFFIKRSKNGTKKSRSEANSGERKLLLIFSAAKTFNDQSCNAGEKLKNQVYIWIQNFC